MARIPQEEIDRIRNEANIVDVIGRYIQVEKSGKDYKAKCPFHDDHDPSLSISPSKQIYKCFVCGAGGNVFTFVQRYENVSFPEAVERVAKLIGHSLSVSVTPLKKEIDPDLKKLYRVMNETIQYTMYQFDTPVGIRQKEYLDRRGLNEETRKTFEIGFNPENDVLLEFLRAKGYDTQDMVDCNVVRSSSGGLHDVFEGRILFPIHDEFGNPIGFTARSIDPNNPSKYINTTETRLFHKSNIVYNAHRAKMSARRNGKIIVTEGVTDVIALYKSGIENVVCTLGTSCTKEQIQILKGMSIQVVFCYDGDRAGQAATVRAGKMAKEAGCKVSVIQNETNKDPDEIFKEYGKEGVEEFIANELTWIQFYISYLKDHYNLNNYSEKKEFAKEAMKEIDTLEDPIDRSHFTKKIAELTGFELATTTNQDRIVKPTRTVRNVLIDGKVAAEEYILTMMMKSYDACLVFVEKLGYLTDQHRNTIAMLIVDARRNNKSVSVDSLMDVAQDPIEQEILARIATSHAYDLEYDEEALKGAIRKVQISVKESQAEALKQQLIMPMNTQTREMVLKEYQKCLIELRGYIDEENKH